MIVEHQDKLISSEIFEKKFVCDLAACKGACCVEGSDGAPLEVDEVSKLEELVESGALEPYLHPKGKAVIEQEGVFYMDWENEPVTTLVEGGACTFANFDDNGMVYCAIEKAWKDGVSDFRKPISCHLYPIRVSRVGGREALNYHVWPICKDACACGEKLDVKVFRFLKDPITRRWGADFYADLEGIDTALQKEGQD